jgi:LacI family transcriptional regulator
MPSKSSLSNVTMADVARASNVSLSTVSLVLNQKPGIPHETRLKVLQAAKTLGYQLKTPLTAVDEVGSANHPIKTVGVLVKSQMDDPIPPTSNVFYSHVLAGIEEACRQHDLFLMLSAMKVDSNSFLLEVPKLVQDSAVDAVLFVGVCINEAMDIALRECGQKLGHVPTVLVDAHSYLGSYDSIVVENYGAGYQATNYLIENGHQHIAFIGGYENSHPSFVDRRLGYAQALKDKNIDQSYMMNCSYNDPQAVYEVVCRLKNDYPHVTAVLGCNDKVAIEILQAAAKLEINLPDELSVIGFDNITLSDKVLPPLTTIHIDKLSMGRLAVEMTLYRAHYPESAIAKTSLYPILIERQSVSRRQD